MRSVVSRERVGHPTFAFPPWGTDVTWSEISSGNEHVAYDAGLLPGLTSRHFDAEYLQGEGLLVGVERSPRGAAWVFRFGGTEFILRHYRRGGALSRLNHDRYLWISRERSRPAREWRMLVELRARGLPVPEPAAWRVVRCSPLLYRADFMTRLIPRCETLHRHLLERELTPEGWRCLGATLRRFHDCQVWHPDLTAGNVLVDESGRFYVVDFDRARRRGGQGWKARNINRLRRSLHKERALVPLLRYWDEHFRVLMDGYRAGS